MQNTLLSQEPLRPERSYLSTAPILPQPTQQPDDQARGDDEDHAASSEAEGGDENDEVPPTPSHDIEPY